MIIKQIASNLFERKYKTNRLFLNTHLIEKFADNLVHLLYPQRNKIEFCDKSDLEIHLLKVHNQLQNIINNLKLCDKGYDRDEVCNNFFLKLEEIEEKLDRDAKSIHMGDPASLCVEDVILCYPGFYAIAIYRVAHEFYKMNVPLLPRLLGEYAHQRTGIEIHPGAKIGENFCVDHGTGVVIGETTEIGDNVKIYQGVTLGALSVEKGLAGKKRHPTIENGAVIYSNATILGGKTVVGENSIIGGNVWLTESVPSNSLVYHKSEVHMKKNKIPEKPDSSSSS